MAGAPASGILTVRPTDEPDTVEVAFVVQDGWQNRGLGTILFRAYVLADNRRMLDLITRFGQVHERKTDQGVTELLFTRREERAAARR